MRLAIALLLITASASAAERVVVAPPMLKVVINAHLLRDFCSSEADFDACTRFVAFRLQASCVPGHDRWSIEASATFKPWIVLYNLHSLAHEKLHIDDVRTMTERYVDTLGRESFATRDRCEASALAASTNFEQTIREFALRSNAERHPNLVRLTRK